MGGLQVRDTGTLKCTLAYYWRHWRTDSYRSETDRSKTDRWYTAIEIVLATHIHQATRESSAFLARIFWMWRMSCFSSKRWRRAAVASVPMVLGAAGPKRDRARLPENSDGATVPSLLWTMRRAFWHTRSGIS